MTNKDEWYTYSQLMDDQRDLANWAAPLLDETPIDEAWLRDIATACVWLIDDCEFLPPSNVYFRVTDKVRAIVGRSTVAVITTRGQLRLLARALGIELKPRSEP